MWEGVAPRSLAALLWVLWGLAQYAGGAGQHAALMGADGASRLLDGGLEAQHAGGGGRYAAGTLADGAVPCLDGSPMTDSFVSTTHHAGGTGQHAVSTGADGAGSRLDGGRTGGYVDARRVPRDLLPLPHILVPNSTFVEKRSQSVVKRMRYHSKVASEVNAVADSLNSLTGFKSPSVRDASL